jgi:S1-C subfamily serine protease
MGDVSLRGGARANPDAQQGQEQQAANPHGAGGVQQDPNAATGATGGGSMRGVKVRFGIAPGDYSGSDPGVLVGDVYPETSAALAGLKAGDLITKWNSTEVKSVEDWMPLLSAHEPGDVVKITYVRDGKVMQTEAKLKGRGGAN